jgi:rhodanese-related sulfurtransferase
MIRENTMKIVFGWAVALPMLFVLTCSSPSWAQAPTGKMTDRQTLQELSDRIPRVPMLSVKPKALAAWLADIKTVLIVDLRDAEAFNRRHLSGAVNIPLNALPERYQELPLDRIILLVDEAGTTTLLAGSYLIRKGFINPVRLFGGMEAWRAFEKKRGS